MRVNWQRRADVPLKLSEPELLLPEGWQIVEQAADGERGGVRFTVQIPSDAKPLKVQNEWMRPWPAVLVRARITATVEGYTFGIEEDVTAQRVSTTRVDTLPLTLVPAVRAVAPEGGSLIDVGSGAGFPGLALKVALPDLRAVLPAEPVVLAVADRADPDTPLPDGVLVARHEGRTVLLAAAGTEESVFGEVLLGPVGLSSPGGYPDLAAARSQAERAMAAAAENGEALQRFDQLPGGLFGLLDNPAGARLADDLLAPIDEQRAAAELLASLRAYLAASGRWDAAAEQLGVHRHTLRYRMRRIRELLPGDLDDPDHRTELWIALRVREGRS